MTSWAWREGPGSCANAGATHVQHAAARKRIRKERLRSRTLKKLLIQALWVAGKIAGDDIMPPRETGMA